MARSGSPAKSKSTAVIVDEPKKSVDTVSTTTTTTTTTTVTVVDEETVVAASSKDNEKEKKKEEEEEGKRELPIFNNPLLADEKSTAVALKPKAGRVKVQGGKTATIAVLKMSAPKVDGEVVVMRRMDSNLVNATLMFQAAFPAATEQWITKENSYLAKTYEPLGAVVENSESGSLAGVWVTISQAKELAKEYSIEQFMLPLLNAPARKNTIKAAASSSPSPSTEVVAKEELQTAEETVTAAVVVVDKVAISSSEETVVVEETTEVVTEEKIVETLEIKEVEVTKEKVEVEEKAEKNDQEQEQERERSTGSKRGRDEDDEQAAKDRKRFRGFVTVAVGLAAVAVTIPQVLPYFS
ncbi:hypothetical protein BG015_008230 [Linnemannia schmuckeri]|uniref:HTH APSES-type domain-containing protein n=1 Tax=Linnemannia schmuckeri TaxID=64567 RepID=A0A9P5S9E3_9FUNG|nr:hypothetical protein BG015_008230 [Linnemannia schmuckeri]